jgi:hypothetical protein
MNLAFSAVLITLCSWAAVPAHAIYFRLADTTPTCFAEEISGANDVVVVEWSRRKQSSGYSSDGAGLSATVTSALRQTIYSATLSGASGSFTFKGSASDLGEYHVCFFTDIAANSDRSLDVIVAMDHHDRRRRLPEAAPGVTRNKAPSGEEIFIFTDVDGQQKETLRTHDYIARVTGSLDQIILHMQDISNDMSYFWARQDRMRATSESTFDRVWGFSAITIGVVAVTSWMQFTFLKMFLRAKKLV